MTWFLFVYKAWERNGDIEKRESKNGVHYSNCPWSSDSTECGPDTCGCRDFSNKVAHVMTLLKSEPEFGEYLKHIFDQDFIEWVNSLDYTFCYRNICRESALKDHPEVELKYTDL